MLPLQMDQALIAPMALLGQFPRKIGIKISSLWVPCRSLWPTSEDKPVKDFTATRGRIEVTERYPESATIIFDGMAVLQKFKPPVGATFHIVADRLFDTVASYCSKRLDVARYIYETIY